DVRKRVADEPVDGLEMPPARSVKQHDKKSGADGHLHRASAADQLQHFVDQHRHDEDVDEIPPAETRRRRKVEIQVTRRVSVSPRWLALPAPSLRPRAPGRCGRREAPQLTSRLPCPSRAPMAGDRPSHHEGTTYATHLRESACRALLP